MFNLYILYTYKIRLYKLNVYVIINIYNINYIYLYIWPILLMKKLQKSGSLVYSSSYSSWEGWVYESYILKALSLEVAFSPCDCDCSFLFFSFEAIFLIYLVQWTHATFK